MSNKRISKHNPATSQSRVGQNLHFVLRRLVSRLTFREPALDLYSKLRHLSKRRSTKGFYNYIKNSRRIRIIGSTASVLLILLTLATLFPLYYKEPSTVAESVPQASTSLTVASGSSNTAKVSVTPTSSTGTFASSDLASSASFIVTSTNYTGYTLTLSPSSSSQSNVLSSSNGSVFNSITDTNGISLANFSSPSYTSLNNMWGISYVSSMDDSVNSVNPTSSTDSITYDTFYPASEELTLGRTNTPNIQGANDTYYIGLGLRATPDQVAGAYTNTTSYTYKDSTTGKDVTVDNSTNAYILTAVGNPIAYAITYLDQSGDESVSGIPNTPISTGASNNTITLLSASNVTRTGYTLTGWCSVDNSTNTSECKDSEGNEGITYAPGASYALDPTGANTVTFYAIWTINQYTCTKQYRLQNADGTWGSYVVDNTLQLDYNSTCSYNKTVTDYKNSASGSNDSEASTSGTVTTSGVTLSLDFYRNTYSLTVNRNTSYISSASATTTAVHTTSNLPYYRWGQSVSITASASSGNKFTTWSQTSPTTPTGTFGSATTANTTFTMPKANTTIYAEGATDKIYMQNMTSSQCTTTAKTVYDNRDNEAYLVQKLADGKCWMLDNLRLDSSTASLTTSNTNMQANVIATATRKTSGLMSYTDAQINVSNKTKIATTKYGSGSGKIGVYYNYCAASAGTYCVDSVSGGYNSYYDVCPKGWRMPTGGPNGEYQALYKAYNSNNTSFREALSLLISGHYTSTADVSNGSGYFLSSTGSSGSEWAMYHMEYDGRDALQRLEARTNGYSMRCVLK